MDTNKLTNKSFVQVFVILGFILMTSVVWATTYYVDATNGNDSNSGTSESAPWKTIAKVNKSYFKPGDFVLFKRGKTWREQLTVPSSGSAGNPITFGAYGIGDSPVINGSDSVLGVSGDWVDLGFNKWRKNIGAANPNGVLFDAIHWGVNDSSPNSKYEWTYSNPNLIVYSAGSPTLYYTSIEVGKRNHCIQLDKDYITIETLTLRGANGSNIGQWDAQADYNIVQHCTIEWSCRQGIYVGQSASISASNWTVQDNIFSNNGTRLIYDHSIYTKWCLNWTIQNNIFSYSKAYAIQLVTSSSNIVRYNYSYDNSNPGGGFLAIWDNGDGPSQNNQAYYNISNGDYLGCFLGGNSNNTGNKLMNNTFYNFVWSGIAAQYNADYDTVKNNIIWSVRYTGSVIHLDSGSTITTSDYNDLGQEATGFIKYNGQWYHTFSAYQSGKSKDLNSISSAPLFIDVAKHNFGLRSSSPCIDKGEDVFLMSDYTGNKVQNPPDIGAHEYRATIPNPPQRLRIILY